MDGEDMMINLPYLTIRDTIAQFGDSLDEITKAHLTIQGLGLPENVLVERRTNKVTGLLDFGQAIWGDPAFARNEAQGEECEGTRGLLYGIYHAVVAVVGNHYRPQRGEGELEARKALTSILARLVVER